MDEEPQMPLDEQISRYMARVSEVVGQAITDYFERNRPAIEAVAKLMGDPEIQRALESTQARRALRDYKPCHCLCGASHPDDKGVCDMNAVTTRRYVTGAFGTVDVWLCAPCMAAQALREITRL